MEEGHLDIDVIGKSGVGKTFIQILIADMLTSHGFKVKLLGDDGQDWDELKATMGSDIIKAILDKTKEIKVNEVRVVTPMRMSDPPPYDGTPLCPNLTYEDTPGSTF